MKIAYIQAINNFINKYNLNALKEVFIFFVIIVGFHFLFRFWAYDLKYFPIKPIVFSLYEFLTKHVFLESSWFVSNVLNIEITTIKQTMYFGKHGYIGINAGCSGLKQYLEFVVLMLLYPGPWKHKLWFIPVGVFIVHLTNLFRIIGLSVVLINYSDYWKFSHDNLFRPFFYVVIFIMWVIWVEYFYKKKKHPSKKSASIKK